MLLRGIGRIGTSLARLSETPFLSSTIRWSTAASNSTEATSETSAEKFELKDSKGSRLRGSEFQKMLKERETDAEQIPQGAFEALVREYDSLLDEEKDWKDRYQRALAEAENIRRRGVKQVADTKIFAIQGFCKDLLEVADILDLAVNSVTQEDLTASSKSMQDMHGGVAMTKTVLLKTFAKHGLRPYSPIGEKFDPTMHEAVFQVPKAQAKQDVGSVELVMKIGYQLYQRPIRPAQVGVVID